VKNLVLWLDWEIVTIPSSTKPFIQLILVLRSISNQMQCNCTSCLTPPLICFLLYLHVLVHINSQERGTIAFVALHYCPEALTV
jgi:hypothetical protein